MTDCATLQAQLVQAEAAYHRLMTGSLEETLHYGEKKLTYTKTDAGRLQVYIAGLRQQVAACTGAAVANRRRMIRPFFGDN